MTVYEQNIGAIQATQPDLYEAIQQYKRETTQQSSKDNSVPYSVTSREALDGSLYLVCAKDATEYALNSTYAPAYAAKRYVKQFEKIDPRSNLLFLGFANGEYAKALLEQDEQAEGYYFYEPCKDLFLHVLEVYDISKVILSPKTVFFVKDLNDSKLDVCMDQDITYNNWKYFHTRSLPNYKQLFPEEERRISMLYRNCLSSKQMDMNTLFHYAQIGLRNNINNLQWIYDGTSASALVGQLADMPLVIISAGPSLEKNIEELAKLKGYAFLMAVDSALPFLLRHNVIPDAVCTVDSNKATYRFQDERIQDIPLIMTADSNCRIPELLPRARKIIATGGIPYYDRMFEQVGSELPQFSLGGSVATMAFSLGVYLKFKRIILVGQDLALANKQLHAGEGDAKNYRLDGGLISVEGIDGEQVYTTLDFQYYLNWFGMHIPELKEIEVIDATEGGAKIQGTVILPLKKVRETYCSKQYNVQELLASIPNTFDTNGNRILYDTMRTTLLQFKRLQRTLRDAIANAERGVTLMERGNPPEKELKAIEKKLTAASKQVECEDENYFLIKRMIESDVEVSEDLYKSDENLYTESIRLYRKMIRYMQSLLDAEEELFPLWEQMLDTVKERYQY